MMDLKRICFFTAVFTLLSLNNSYSKSLKLNNLSSNELSGVSKEFSANFIHSAVAPASPLGDIFGFEVGVLAGVTKSPDLESLTTKADPTASGLSSIPYIGLLGSVSIPFGFTFELGYLPKTKVSSVELDSFGLGLKWTFDKLIVDIPFIDLAFRAHYSDSGIKFSQTISGANSVISLDNSVHGLQVLASVGLLVFEPYLGIGYVKGKSDIETNLASSGLFSFTSSNSASASDSSLHIVAGAQANLFFMKTSVEMMRAFGTTRYGMKLTFGI